MILPYVEGIEFGAGICSLTGQTRGDGVECPPPGDGEGASELTFFSKRVDSTEELSSVLNVSAEASAGFGLFSGSLRFQFARETSIHSYSLFYTVWVKRTNAARTCVGAHLKQPAYDLLAEGTDNAKATFRKRYGDLWVRTKQTGGEYFVLIEIRTRSDEELEKITMDLRAKGLWGGFGASAEGHLATEARQFLSTQEISIRSYQIGGLTPKLPTDLESIFKKAVNFAAEVAGDNGEVFLFEAPPYTVLDLPPARTPLDIEIAQENLDALLKKRGRYLKIKEDIEYVLIHQDEFVSFDAGLLNQVREVLRRDIQVLTTTASRYANQDPTLIGIPHTAFDGIELPNRRSRTTSIFFPAPNLVGLNWNQVQTDPTLQETYRAINQSIRLVSTFQSTLPLGSPDNGKIVNQSPEALSRIAIGDPIYVTITTIGG